MHYHFIREKVLQEEIELKHVNTKDQVANLFTKSLSGNKFVISSKWLTEKTLVLRGDVKNYNTSHAKLLAKSAPFPGSSADCLILILLCYS